MAKIPILITGGSGQVGSAVKRLAKRSGREIYAPTRLQLDLANENSIMSAIRDGNWSAVINCGAYTLVDKAETERELARKINGIAPAILARETELAGIPLIHVSTDYVFNGKKTSPYSEHDPVDPVNIYGKTKEEGESAVRAANPLHAIIRTAWVVSAEGANFLNTMLRLALDHDEISVVNDQFGSPTSADDIAMALLAVAGNLQERNGTWHFVNSGRASWYDFAAHIFSETGLRGLPSPDITAISSAKYPTPAERPSNSLLSTAAIERDFNISPRPWQIAINDILAERLG